MSRVKRNETAKDFWKQVFAREAQREDAALWDPAYDPSPDEKRLREAFRGAGWTEEETEQRIREHNEAIARAPEPNSGVNPLAQVMYRELCVDVEAAMDRLHRTSHETVAHGIEPRIGPFASKMNVVMTEESVITVGVHLFRYCGLIARAFARTLMLNAYLWSDDRYRKEDGRACLAHAPHVVRYWLDVYLSYALTGTNILVPFKPSGKHEVILMEQVARSMEIFAIAHEYGHHDRNHGRGIGSEAMHAEEFEADQFALRICWEVERRPVLGQNPYLPSGAGGAILLMSVATLRKIESLVAGSQTAKRDTHPDPLERIARFDAVALLQPSEFQWLKEYRTTAMRIMVVVEEFMLRALATADFRKLRALSEWKFRDAQ
jgi:hypothetical protein